VNGVLTYGQVGAIIDQNFHELAELCGACVSINSKEEDEYLKLLCMLDGMVGRLVFIPPDISTSQTMAYYEMAEVEYEVSLFAGTLSYKRVSSRSFANDASTQWVVPTSGTTQAPKLVVHSVASLTKSTKRNIEKGKDVIWGLVFDPFRFSGIQVLLQTIFGGSTILIPPNKTSMTKMLAFFVDHRCNAISATPSFWRKAMMSCEIDNLKLQRISLGGEIADQHILNALKHKFPAASIRHIYASTEAGVGFSVSDKVAGFPIQLIEYGVNNAKLKIENGTLWICPENKDQHYLSREMMFDNDGFIDTGDLVEIIDDRVTFIGRDSGAINVGGDKVIPEEVELQLLSSGLISGAHVYAKKSSMMGSLVYANVVSIETDFDKRELKKSLFAQLRETLDSYKVPAVIKFVDSLEVTANGKLLRK